VPAIGPCRSDSHNLFLDAFLRRERDTRREEVDEVGRAGGERLLRGRSAAVSGDLGGDTVLLVITQLVGRIDRRERSVIGNGKPDLDRGLGVRARRPGEEQPMVARCAARQRRRFSRGSSLGFVCSGKGRRW
jgi:hypothetical protein